MIWSSTSSRITSGPGPYPGSGPDPGSGSSSSSSSGPDPGLDSVFLPNSCD